MGEESKRFLNAKTIIMFASTDRLIDDARYIFNILQEETFPLSVEGKEEA